MFRNLRFVPALGVAALVLAGSRAPDDLDAFIEKEMAQREIVGLSLAIIDDGRIVDTRVYGTTTRGGSTRVTPTTLFQAGSVSKPVAALAALQQVERGALTLDEDVNTKLKAWKVPDNEFTTTERVTLRRLLSHTAGLTVHGFPGYAVTETVPTVQQVLDGIGNTAPVRVNVVPGSIWRYSGGGYTVMQQLVVDVTGKSFPDYMRENVLEPLGMTNSTYEQPLPAALAAKTADGHYANRSPVKGRWHVYPEMAAAGLWTTPTDLARYAIGVQQALAGKSKVLSADMAKQMLTVQKGEYGLGPGLAGSGNTLRFSHGGRDAGFDAYLIAYAENGDGAVIMINANENTRVVPRIINLIAQKYNWPGYPIPTPAATGPAVELPPAALAAVTGRYEFQNNNIMTLIAHNGRIYTDVLGLMDEEFVPQGHDRFASSERAITFRPERNDKGEIVNLEWTGPGVARDIPRIGPLFPPTSAPDPDPAFTRGMMTVLAQFAEGSTAVSSSTLLTEGARKIFTQPNTNMKYIKGVTFVHREDVRGRGIVRHGHPVEWVQHYRVATPAGDRLLLVHVAAKGEVADYDMVSK